MTVGINAHRWKFLQPEKAAAYIAVYNSVLKEQNETGWKRLKQSTLKRQFRTASEILNRLNKGQKGVLLADDVGLGKTTVAALCALVFAGSEKRVRILAPNDVMARRWRQEMETHVDAVSQFATHLKLGNALKRANHDVQKLHAGTIQVSTHFKANQLSCDLLIIDEAHRAKSKNSSFAKKIGSQIKKVGRILVLTATPFSIDPNELERLLQQIGGKEAKSPMKKYAKLLDHLWNKRIAGEPNDIAQKLVEAAKFAIDAMRPFVIRHGIDDLSANERKSFGDIDEQSPEIDVSVNFLEAMLRSDRALRLMQKHAAFGSTRTNDPRYHVGKSQLSHDLDKLIDKTKGNKALPRTIGINSQAARKLVKRFRQHPKVADTVSAARSIVEKGEKVLIFCDHHATATELAVELANRLQWPSSSQCEPQKTVWQNAWEIFFERERESLDCQLRANKRLCNFINWLMSQGVRKQIVQWLGESVSAELSENQLVKLLKTFKARNQSTCLSIADHAIQLYKRLVDPESRSTNSVLAKNDVSSLPGATLRRVAAVCCPEVIDIKKFSNVFFSNQPDTVLAIFNSPFGPDVLVTTDRLSEGVDLHQFCRHLIHHELDPSPIRTIQRNGRLRRVNSWAARTNKPIEVYYPTLVGTRDEKLVSIMRGRLEQFDLLLGGIRGEIDPEQPSSDTTLVSEILSLAKPKLKKLGFGL